VGGGGGDGAAALLDRRVVFEVQKVALRFAGALPGDLQAPSGRLLALA
jgi:hypothetical protein